VTNATGATFNVPGSNLSDYYIPLLKEARLKVNDKLGSRMAVQAGGSQLWGWALKNDVCLDRGTALSKSAASLAAANNLAITYPIFIRHPGIDEPIGNMLGIPLDQVNEDVILEFDIEAVANLSLTNNPTIATTAYVTIITREVDPAVAYLPTELITSSMVVNGTGRQGWDIPQGGFLSSILIDSYEVYPTKRRDTLAAQNIEIRYGTNVVREILSANQAALNDYFIGAVPATYPAAAYAATITAAQWFEASYFMDFLFDDSLGSALSPGSLLNANAIPLGGDKIRFEAPGFSNSGDTLKLTCHKFLARNPDDLKVLVGA
jgi:hypothetical protein